MPKAKPISLWPLSFDEALKKLIGTPPAAKATKPKKKSKARHRG
jgi:hypothetical protein